MILIDSSVWIDYFRGDQTSQTDKLDSLRKLGMIVPKTIDTVIATRCIEGGYELLHDDRDFDSFVAHLGLRSVL